MKIRTAVPAALVAVALAGFAGGCGDDEDDNGSAKTPPGQTSAAAPKLSGEPLRVGLLCACTGPTAGTSGGLPKLAQAWEQWTNAHGGINGHPVQVIVADDKNDPAASARMARKLVEEDNVQAIVSGGYLEEGWAKYTAGKEVPVTGGNSVNPTFATNPMFFPSGATFPTIFYGVVNEAKKRNKTKLAAFACAELPVCAAVPQTLDAIGEQVIGGVEVVYSGKIAATAANYTAQCVGAKKSGADSAIISHSSEVVVRVAKSCSTQGFKPLEVNTSSTLGANILKEPALDGYVTSQQNIPLGVLTTPGAKAFDEAMDEYAADYKKSSQFGVISMNIWAGFELFKAGAKAGKLDATSTPKDVTEALYTLKDETLEGISPPLNFVKGQPTFPACYYVQTVEGGELAAPDGDKLTCIPEDQQVKLGKLFAAATG